MDARTGNLEHDAKGHRARLRERLLDGGPRGFHDYELVEYLLALTIPRVDTKPMAKKLIAQFGGIGPLLAASAESLKREGLSEATVAALKSRRRPLFGCSKRRSKAAPFCRAGMRLA